MKKIITPGVLAFIYLLTMRITLFAQPVLVNTMALFPVGTTDSVYLAAASISPGTGGAGVTWNFSGLVPAVQGIVNIVTPSSSPYFSTFPTTTFCAQISLTGGSTIYTYQRMSSTKFETLANNYAGPGTGKDYSPNPESELEFPMNYLDAFVDTYQTTVAGPYTTAITYDGYGTLITPFGTYTNVVRIYKYWGPGDYDYDWLVTSPYLGIVASFDAQSNAYTLVRPVGTTGVKGVAIPGAAQLYPDPVTENAILKVDVPNGLYDAAIIITDVTGRVVKQMAIFADETTINRDGLRNGIYFYQVFNNGERIAGGKLVIQ